MGISSIDAGEQDIRPEESFFHASFQRVERTNPSDRPKSRYRVLTSSDVRYILKSTEIPDLNLCAMLRTSVSLA